MDIVTYLKDRKSLVDTALTEYLHRNTGAPERLIESMRYSVAAGGKRLRPILVLAGAAAVGGDATTVLPCACALEMIHTFSLIHDDLPAMDNDDLRRGVPTNHKVYGEALAILAGDGLLSEAFCWLTELSGKVPADRLVAVIRDIAHATGSCGMVGGQVLDMDAEGQSLTLDAVTHLHQLKTGALLRVSVTSGAKLSGANADQLAALSRYGEAIGMAFQIADDLLGVDGSEKELGKRVGSDAARGKATYPAMAGVPAARDRMIGLTTDAIEAMAVFDHRAEPLRLLARYITDRRN